MTGGERGWGALPRAAQRERGRAGERVEDPRRGPEVIEQRAEVGARREQQRDAPAALRREHKERARREAGDRIEREYDIDLITTAPSVIYDIHMKDGTVEQLHNPADMPDLTFVDHIEEPRIKATILVPDDYLGDVLKLCQDRRGIQMDLTYAGSRAMVVYDLPLNEVVFDFYDRLKSVTKGYASFDYSPTGMRSSKLVKVDILLNANPVDALSALIHTDNAYTIGKKMCEKLRELIPRQQFDIPIQAAIL